jgi:hypothetical protein
VTGGNSAYLYFRKKHQFTEISLFSNYRFALKINQVAHNFVEADALWSLANRVNLKAQANFDKAHPV